MTAKDFRQEQDYPYNHFTKLTSTGISPDYDHIEEYAEAYHQAKVENLDLHSVVASFLKDKAIQHKVDPEKVLAGLNSGKLTVEIYDEGACEIWKRLE